MFNRSTSSKIGHYFIHVRVLSCGSLEKVEIPAAKAFLQRQFPELAEAITNFAVIHPETIELSHQKIQSHLTQIMRSFGVSGSLPESSTKLSINTSNLDDAKLAECCLRCFVSHYISLVCIELEQRFRSQSGFRAVDVLPYVLSDTDPRKSKQDYERAYQKEYQLRKRRLQADDATNKDYKFQVPLAIHIVHTFDPDKGNLLAWTKLLTPQHRELNRILTEHGIHRKTDWSILNSHNPTRVKRLLSGVLTSAEMQAMTAVLESYHTVYRQDRRQTKQAGKACKDPDQDQLERMVCDLEQRGIKGYSPEQVMQILRSLALKLRHRQLETNPEQEEYLPRHQSHAAVEEREQELFMQYQQELLSECLNQAVKQVLDAHLVQLRQKTARKSAKKRPKDQIFLEAMRLFYCEGRSMSEIAHMIGRKQEYQVSRILELKTLREQIRQPWYSLTCTRIARLLAAYADLEQLKQRQQQIEQLIAMQIDQIIMEDKINRLNR